MLIKIRIAAPHRAQVEVATNGVKAKVTAEVRSFRGEKPLTAESERYRLFPLIPFDPQQSFETYHVEIDPGTVFLGEPHEGNVYEYVFVFKGKLQISIEGKKFEINKNEFLRFQANCPQGYKYIGKKTASAIMQISHLV